MSQEQLGGSSQLDGKSIVIIGGTTGLGQSAAVACAAAGARVVVVGRRQESLDATLSQLGARGSGELGDAIDSTTAPRAIRTAIERFGGFDGLYHVAGGSGRPFGDGPLHTITDGGWAKTLQLNLTALFYSNRAAAQSFVERGTGGSVVNMGSVLGFSPSPRFFATHAYAAAKAAVIGFTRSIAAYYAERSIRFNVVAPALVETPMSQRAAQDDEILEFIKTKQPLDGGRIGRPEDLDALVVHLLSDASRFMTGQVLAVDGGWTVSEGQIPQAPTGPAPELGAT